MNTSMHKYRFAMALAAGILLCSFGSGCAFMRPNNNSNRLVDGPVNTGNPVVDTVGNGLAAGTKKVASWISGDENKGASDNVYAFFNATEAKEGFVPPTYSDEEGKKIAVVPFEGNGITFKKSVQSVNARKKLVQELDKVGTGSPRCAELAGAIAAKSSEIAATERVYYPIAMRYVGDQIGARVRNRDELTAQYGNDSPVIARIDEDIRFLVDIYRTVEARFVCASVVPENYVRAEFSLAEFGTALDNFIPQPIVGLDPRAYAQVQAIAGESTTSVPVVVAAVGQK